MVAYWHAGSVVVARTISTNGKLKLWYSRIRIKIETAVAVAFNWVSVIPVDNCDISKQLLRFFNAAINGFECISPLDGDDTEGGRDDDGVACVTQSASIALEALRLKCSKKLSICTSIDFGVVFAILHSANYQVPLHAKFVETNTNNVHFNSLHLFVFSSFLPLPFSHTISMNHFLSIPLRFSTAPKQVTPPRNTFFSNFSLSLGVWNA